MAVVRWEPLRELSTLQHEMNRLFGSFFDAPASSGATVGATRQWVPAMDLVETPEHYVLRADLPGLTREDVKIELEENVLTVSGERRSADQFSGDGFHRIERAVGTFARSLTLPTGVEAERIEATFANGVLEVRIPKPEQRKPRRVEIGLGDAPATVEGTESTPAIEPEPAGIAG